MDKVIMKIKYILISLLFLCAQVGASTLPPQAQNLLDRYMNSLVNGDTDGLNSILGGKLLDRRKVLLENPVYASELRNAYRNTRYEILSTTELAEDTLQLDVRLWYVGQGTRVIRLIMVNEAPSNSAATRYRIHGRFDDVDLR